MQIDRRFYATMLGSVVTDKLIQAFPEIMDVGFTAGMELQARRDRGTAPRLDQAAARISTARSTQVVDGALDKIEHAGGSASPYKCHKCGKQMVYRISKNGFFLACTEPRVQRRPSRSISRASRRCAR